MKLQNNIWKLICAGGYNNGYLSANEILTDTLFTVGINYNSEIIQKFTLHQNYPNPFNPSTKINYEIKTKSDVTLKINDVLGNVVETIINQNQNAGSYSINFDATNLPGGVYFYTLKANQIEETKKMLLIK